MLIKLILWVLVVAPLGGLLVATGIGCYSDYKQSMKWGIPYLWIQPKKRR